jgi:hypothetical protein
VTQAAWCPRRQDKLECEDVGQRCKHRMSDCPRNSEGAAGAQPVPLSPSLPAQKHHWGPSVLLLWVQYPTRHQEALWWAALEERGYGIYLSQKALFVPSWTAHHLKFRSASRFSWELIREELRKAEPLGYSNGKVTVS